jgi:putative membrane protein
MSADKMLEESGEKLADSAKEIEHSTLRVEDSADRRTELSGDRTVFAAERTYAAWVRTGLLALASGIGARALLAGVLPNWMSLATATVLMMFSAFCFGAGVWRHLNPGARPPLPDVSQLSPYLLIAINGFLALVALAAMVGIWFGRTP